MAKNIIPLVHMWKTYPEQVKKLIDNPLLAFYDAFEKANGTDDWENIHDLVEIISYIAKTTPNQR